MLVLDGDVSSVDVSDVAAVELPARFVVLEAPMELGVLDVALPTDLIVVEEMSTELFGPDVGLPNELFALEV